MHDENDKQFLSHAVLSISTITFYLMGTGIFQYLGGIVDWVLFITGLVIVVLFQISSLQMDTFFEIKLSRTIELPGEGEDIERQRLSKETRLKRTLLSAIATFSTGSILIYYLSIQHKLSAASLFVFVSLILIVLLYAVPPFKMTSRGLGELVQAVFIGFLVPAFGFLLQNGEMHRLIPMITTPFTTLLLAALISSNLPIYQMPDEKKYLTLEQINQWNIKIDLHNWLIFLTYIFIALAVFTGLPWGLTWPLLIGFPLSVLSVHEMVKIKNGAKPNRFLVLLGGLGAAGCTIYMVTFALWIA